MERGENLILEINKVINHYNDSISKVGWFLYNISDSSDGLSKNETEELVRLLSEIDIEKDLQQSYSEGFDEGYDSGKIEGYYAASKKAKSNPSGLEEIIDNITYKRNGIYSEYD